jgi:predicted Zn-ribbon and HTH transcriptional regulator
MIKEPQTWAEEKAIEARQFQEECEEYHRTHPPTPIDPDQLLSARKSKRRYGKDVVKVTEYTEIPQEKMPPKKLYRVGDLQKTDLEINGNRHTCLRCGYNWSGVPNPTTCPNCESALWNKPRKDRRYTMQKIRGMGKLQCAICGQITKPRIQKDGKMPRGYRFCPNGCQWPIVF